MGELKQHDGSEQPCRGDALVTARLRDGSVVSGEAHTFFGWRWRGPGTALGRYDILEYALATPPQQEGE